jgi:nucleoside-diphosphate-sugar epimerase
MGVLLITGGAGFIGSTLTKVTLDWKPIVDFEEGIKGLVQERLSLN